MTVAKSGGSEETDDHDYSPLRTLTMPDIQNFATVIAPLQDFARERGGRFLVSSPGQQPSSIMFDIDVQRYFIVGGDRLKASGLEFFLYWRSDATDDQALDTIAEQLRQVLIPFGTVTVTAAPPGSRPRQESTNLWRKKR